MRIHLPPLRERREDIPLLSEHFLKRYNKELTLNIKRISSEAMRVLMDYPWPGNVRELQNCIYESMVLSTDDVIGVEDIPTRIFEKRFNTFTEGKTLAEVLEIVEAEMIKDILKKTKGKKLKQQKYLE